MKLKSLFLFIVFAKMVQAESKTYEPEAGFMDVSLEELVDVNITSITKMAMPLNKSPVSAYVIKQDEISRKGYRFLPEILKNTPNFHVVNYAAGTRMLTKIYVRGIYANDKIVVLIDGIKVKPPTSEPSMFYSSIPLIDVKQIEISLGTSSSIYGADAMLATVNIVTENGEGLNGFKIKATGGEAGMGEVQVAAGKKINDDISVSLTGSFHSSNQEDSTHNYLPNVAGNLGTINVAEQNHSFRFKTNYKDLTLSYYRLHNDINNSLFYDSIVPKGESGSAFRNMTNQLANATYNLEINPFWQAKSIVTYETTNLSADSTYRKSPSSNDGNGGSTWTVAETIAYLRGDVNWLSGVELNFMKPGVLKDRVPANYEDYAAYSQLSYNLTETLSLNGSVRMDADSRYDPVFNPRVGFSWQAIKELRFFGAWGTAYLSPAAFHPGHEPQEELKTSEVGFNAEPFKTNNFNASWFYNDGTNITRPNSPLGTLDTHGFSVTDRQKFANGISADVNYTLTDGVENNSTNLTSVAKHMIKSNLLYDLDKFTFRFTGRWFDGVKRKNSNVDYNGIILDSNVHYSQPFRATEWSIDLGVTNLLNNEYYTNGYNSDGIPRFQQETRRVYLTLGLSY